MVRARARDDIYEAWRLRVASRMRTMARWVGARGILGAGDRQKISDRVGTSHCS